MSKCGKVDFLDRDIFVWYKLEVYNAGVKGKDFLEYNYVSKNKELEKNGARLGVCHWDCILNLEIAKLIVAANLYGNFTLNFALPYLKKILSKTEFNKVCF